MGGSPSSPTKHSFLCLIETPPHDHTPPLPAAAAVERRQGGAAAGSLPQVQPELGAVVQAAAFKRWRGEAVRLRRVQQAGVSRGAHPGVVWCGVV